MFAEARRKIRREIAAERPTSAPSQRKWIMVQPAMSQRSATCEFALMTFTLKKHLNRR
jgi:hypothetical protein